MDISEPAGNIVCSADDLAMYCDWTNENYTQFYTEDNLCGLHVKSTQYTADNIR